MKLLIRLADFLRLPLIEKLPHYYLGSNYLPILREHTIGDLLDRHFQNQTFLSS